VLAPVSPTPAFGYGAVHDPLDDVPRRRVHAPVQPGRPARPGAAVRRDRRRPAARRPADRPPLDEATLAPDRAGHRALLRHHGMRRRGQVRHERHPARLGGGHRARGARAAQATRSRLFSPCPVAGRVGADLGPNTFVDEVTVLGLPGALPVPNAEALRLAVRSGLALGSTIRPRSRFARKHYFYPDLPKGYQITQQRRADPVRARRDRRAGSPGGRARPSRWQRIHLEEDAGKLNHDGPHLAGRPQPRRRAAVRGA
jgi:hypothetical protein